LTEDAIKALPRLVQLMITEHIQHIQSPSQESLAESQV
jgi:hypothetical protein